MFPVDRAFSSKWHVLHVYGIVGLCVRFVVLGVKGKSETQFTQLVRQPILCLRNLLCL